ncbi:hypothetical protein TNCV_384751 [Trichonephila clavipes]|nr:hypothetical protein TNCV_384751 [Trichonephila clavipes]
MIYWTLTEQSDTDNDEEKIVTMRRKRKRMRRLSNSNDECEENDQNIEISIDGTVQQKLKKFLNLEDPHFILFSEAC